jgi:hypothetical protein
LLQNVIKSLLQPKRFSVAENFQVTFSLGNKSLLWHDHVFSSCCYRQCVVWHTRYNVNVHYCVISYPTLKLSFQERISTLTEKIKDDLLRRMREKHPQFVFDVLIRSTQEQGWYNPDPRPANEPSPTWCRCTHCREMPTEAEKVCCDQAPQNCYHSLQVSHFYLQAQLEVNFFIHIRIHDCTISLKEEVWTKELV